jgi:hypothetical protein
MKTRASHVIQYYSNMLYRIYLGSVVKADLRANTGGKREIVVSRKTEGETRNRSSGLIKCEKCGVRLGGRE